MRECSARQTYAHTLSIRVLSLSLSSTAVRFLRLPRASCLPPLHSIDGQRLDACFACLLPPVPALPAPSLLGVGVGRAAGHGASPQTMIGEQGSDHSLLLGR